MKTTFKLLAVAVVALFAAGCLIAHTDGHGHITRITAIIPHAHVHDANCGHYHWNGGWYIAQGHVHGPGCGHFFRAGIWVED